MKKILQFKHQNFEVPFRSNLFYHVIINVITFEIYDKDFESAKKYIQIGKKQAKRKEDLLYFRMNLKYLENLVNYLTTGNYIYMRRIQECIDLLEDIGDIELAEHLKKEIKLIVHDILEKSSESTLPISLLRES